MELIEIELKVNGKGAFEYQTDLIPRVGDYLDVSHDDISGFFKVMKVTHRVFQQRKDKKVISYAIVEAESSNY